MRFLNLLRSIKKQVIFIIMVRWNHQLFFVINKSNSLVFFLLEWTTSPKVSKRHKQILDRIIILMKKMKKVNNFL